jgi:hypothetical protein
MIIGLVIGTLSAIVAFRLAGTKGRRPALWAVLAFFFGVFALLTLRLLPVRTAAAAPVAA